MVKIKGLQTAISCFTSGSSHIYGAQQVSQHKLPLYFKYFLFLGCLLLPYQTIERARRCLINVSLQQSQSEAWGPCLSLLLPLSSLTHTPDTSLSMAVSCTRQKTNTTSVRSSIYVRCYSIYLVQYVFAPEMLSSPVFSSWGKTVTNTILLIIYLSHPITSTIFFFLSLNFLFLASNVYIYELGKIDSNYSSEPQQIYSK